ncbi:MAG: AI-2E family transporter, partial [Lachnospiraceae bacterium]|nr:AI-2E family transporter [Lachnospiraceae bacterium]
VVGVPIFAVFYAGVKTVVNRALRRRELPTDLQPYMTVGQIDEKKAFTKYVPVKKKKKKEESSDHEIPDSKSK